MSKRKPPGTSRTLTLENCDCDLKPDCLRIQKKAEKKGGRFVSCPVKLTHRKLRPVQNPIMPETTRVLWEGSGASN